MVYYKNPDWHDKILVELNEINEDNIESCYEEYSKITQIRDQQKLDIFSKVS